MRINQLYKRVAHNLEQTRSQVARTVNTAMVQAYWQVGREIALGTDESVRKMMESLAEIRATLVRTTTRRDGASAHRGTCPRAHGPATSSREDL
jgi:hypothetical protein